MTNRLLPVNASMKLLTIRSHQSPTGSVADGASHADLIFDEQYAKATPMRLLTSSPPCARQPRWPGDLAHEADALAALGGFDLTGCSDGRAADSRHRAEGTAPPETWLLG
jgi:hypothetical protein